MGTASKNAKKDERDDGVARISPLSIGLGAFFATLLIYAGAVTPFLRYENITNFVSQFAHVSLASLLVCSCALVVAMMRGASLHTSALMGAGGILYLLSSAAFSLLALSGTGDVLLLYLGSIACGIGDCCLCLLWGRIFRRFSLGSALLNVAVACVIASAVYAIIARAAPVAGVGLFMTCAAVAVVVAFLALGAAHGTSAARGGESEARVDAPTTLRALSSFADVVTKPALGLLVFSYVMGLTCNIFVEVFDTYLASSLLAAALLAALALVRLKRPLTRLLYRDLLPLLAIVTLAAPSICAAILGPSFSTMFFTLLLYSFAAFLTIATLCAIANASEFSSDFIFAAALVLFAAASLAGLLCSNLPADLVNVVVTVATTIYAFLMVVMRDPGAKAIGLERIPLDAPDGEPASVHGGGQRDELVGRTARRCAELARERDLTARESEILVYLAEGHSGAYISDVLFISPNTVRTHIHNIYRKLDASSREDILRMTKE